MSPLATQLLLLPITGLALGLVVVVVRDAHRAGMARLRAASCCPHPEAS